VNTGKGDERRWQESRNASRAVAGSQILRVVLLSGSGSTSTVVAKSGARGLHDAIPSCRRDVSVLHTLYDYDVAFSRGSDDSG
jgi:hypothetical protein